jgi:hypothetical protein
MAASAWLIGPLVDNPGEDPIAVGHDFAGADHQRELQPVEPDISVVSGIDPKHQPRRAVVVRHRRLRVRVDARAQVIAVAALHILAAHRPFLLCHDVALD